MANRDGRLFNVDRAQIYTLQRLFPNRRLPKNLYRGNGFWMTFTPAQRKRMMKKMHKNNDFSL